MNNNQTQKQIQREFSTLHGRNQKEKILSDIQLVDQIEPEKQTKNILLLHYAIPLLCIILILLLIPENQSYEYMISIDVNPSVELQISKDHYIKKVINYNPQMNQIINNLSLENKKLDDGILSLVNSMFENGYISYTKNSLLVSVEGYNKENRKKVKSLVITDIKKVFQEYHLDASILSQDFRNNETIQKYANDYHISIGKAALIQELVSYNSYYSFEDLIDLSINDLNTLIHYNDFQFKRITIDGSESHEAYLSKEDVKNRVLYHSKVIEQDMYNYSCSLDCKESRLIYHASFQDPYGTYYYLINAISGEIISFTIHI